MTHGERNQPVTRIAHSRHARVTYHGDAFTLFQVDNELGRARQFVVLVVADCRLLDAVLVEQEHRMASIFAGDEVHCFQDAQRAEGDVLHVADGGADKIQRARAGGTSVPHYPRCGLRLRHTRKVYTSGLPLSVTSVTDAARVFSNPRMSLKGKGAGGEEGSFRK